MAGNDQYIFRSHQRLASWLGGLLLTCGVLSIAGFVTDLHTRSVLKALQLGSYLTSEEAMAAAGRADLLEGSIAILFLLVYLPAMVLSLMWIYRSSSNAHALSRVRVHPTPGWAVGWYFVPFANLIKPYQAMKEIWAASSNPQDWKQLATPAILQVWWFIWIVGGGLGRLSMRMTLRADDVDSLLAANTVGLIEAIAVLASLIVFHIMVKRITAMQIQSEAIANVPQEAEIALTA